MNHIGKSIFLRALGMNFVHFLFSIFVVLSSVWVCLAIWVQQLGGWLFSRICIGIWIAFALSILGVYFAHFFSRRKEILIYIIAFALSLVWYFNIPAHQNLDWSPDGSRIVNYERHGDMVTLYNIRNFNWKTETEFDEQWDTRTFNLNEIEGINILTSYWMGPQIAHTLVSFDFKNQRPLVFSLEIRKEKSENFSAIGGFFRQFELSLIAADEKDIVYTRTNVRGEQVYFFPIKMAEKERKELFLQYLKKSDDLRKTPKWYNTLTSNCTTLVFDMIQAIEPHKLPRDYRLIASGYLPNYLYDLGALDQKWDMKQWYRQAHLNPRTQEFSHFKYQNSQNFSKVIRLGLPVNPLPPNPFEL